jgi:Cellulase (glycosyl hydrolase family 5)
MHDTPVRPPVTRRHRSRLPWRLCVIAATSAMVAGVLLVHMAGLPPKAPARPAAAPYTWPHGTPAGITLSELQDYEMTPQVVTMMKRQIWAAAHYWHANTVRFQILQDRLVGTEGRRFNRPYMYAIRTVTDYALRLGLTVVLNAQTEVSTGYAVDEPLPTHATQVFWRRMMNVWANNPRVAFDLFNEPRRCTWAQWHTAFQGLIDYIRGHGAGNQLWVEGRWWGSTFAGVPLLRGTGIVYSFHHPGSPWPWQRPVDQQTWNHAFGFLANRGLPIVDGEFPNYVGSYDWGPASLPGANPGRLVGEYFRYLTAHHIGMLAWSLVPGALNSDSTFTSTSSEPQGDGQLVRAWLAATAHANDHGNGGHK